MKYSIEIKTALSLKVRVGKFETFEEAKQQMVKFIVDLINNQKDEVFNAWENLKEDFSEEIQEILNCFEEMGTANIDGDIYDADDNISYYDDEHTFEISGKRDKLGYSLSINTNVINMYDSDENYHFTLTEEYDGGDNEITIELLVNDGSVEVYNVIPDDVRSRLGILDYEDEEDLQGAHTE